MTAFSIKPFPFHEITEEDYLKAAIETARWIQTLEVKEDVGKTWKILPDGLTPSPAGIFLGKRTLYAGSAGIGLFFLRLYQVTKNQEWLNEANAAADYLVAHELKKDYYENTQKQIKEHPENLYGWAFSYKVGPISEAQFALSLFDETGNKELYDFAFRNIDTFLDAAIEDGDKIHWSDTRDIVGDAGGAVVLLQAYKRTSNEKYLQGAIRYANYLKDFAKQTDNGTYYYLYDLYKVNEGEKGTVHVNFSHGSSGIAYFFSVLFEATKNEQYLNLANDIFKYLESIAVGDENATLFPFQYHPEKGPLNRFYLGMCGGPAGSSFAFKKLYEVTGDKKYGDWVKRLFNGLLKAGLPEQKSWGYWGSKCICCGGPGILEYFASLYEFTGDKIYLEYAKRTAKVLLSDSFEEPLANGETGRSWYGAWDRIYPTRVLNYTGFYIGAAGAAGALLRLYGDFKGLCVANFFEYTL